MILTMVIVLGLLPVTAMADEGAYVYLSVSFDDKYIYDKYGDPIVYRPIPLGEIEAISLADYGLEHMLYDGNGDGEYDTTALQLLIYAHEEIYGGDWSEVNFDDIPGASYFAGGIFDFTENLVYFLNGDFPVDDSQQSDFMTVGATSDRIVLEAGDFLDVASFGCYAFLWDVMGGFHLFADPEGNYVHDYVATAGEALPIKLMHSFCDLMYGEAWVTETPDFEVYYGRTFGEAEGSVITDEYGCAEITFPGAGVYYVWSDGGHGSDDGTHSYCDYYFENYEPCYVSSPAYAKVTVSGAAHTHSWDAGIYTAPTTQADGFTTYTCSGCGETKIETHAGTKLPEIVENAIVKQPESVTADTGTNVQFRVEATGDILSYKWEYRKIYKWFDTNLEGNNTDTLTVPAVGSRNGYDYRCTVTFADGTVMVTEPAELTVNTYITNVQNPKDQTVVLGDKGQFTAAATGEGLSYQWEYRRPDGERWIETAMEGAAKPTVYIESTTARDGYQYRCRITDVAGLVTYTQPATMRVLSFKSHPQEVFTATGTTAVFTVTTSVDSGFTYQWQYSTNGGESWFDTTMNGYNTATLSVDAAKSRNGYLYRCVLTGSKNSKIQSKTAVLHVGDPTQIITQPGFVNATSGDTVQFTVEATNVYSYQWKYSRSGNIWFNTTAEGNQTATLTVAAKGKNGYQYRCHIKGLDGTETVTEPATLRVQ